MSLKVARWTPATRLPLRIHNHEEVTMLSPIDDKRIADYQAMRRRMIKHLKEGTTDLAAQPMQVPRGFYTDPERLVRERQRIFFAQPLLAALSQDIANVGDQFVFDAAG